MARIAAILTSAPALVRCELDRVREQFDLDGEGWAAGVGAYEDDMVLQRRYGVGVPRAGLWEVPDSEAVLAHAGPLKVGRGLEEDVPPFRFRQWLFAWLGEVDQADRVRERLLGELPDFLQRSVRGVTLGEVVFGVFLTELRSLGRIEDPSLEAPLAAQLLVKAARLVEQTSSEVGGTARAQSALVATNGRLLVAARRGAQPVAWLPLEGDALCARCELTAESKDSALLRDHRRRRSVVVATDPRRADAWRQVPDGGALAVDRKLSIQLL